MPALPKFLRCCEPVVRASYKASDTLAERDLKGLLIPVFLFLGSLSLVTLAVVRRSVNNMGAVGMVVNTAVLFGGAAALCKFSTCRVMAPTLIGSIVAVVLLDWGQSSSLQLRTWSFGVLTMDLALVSETKRTIQAALVCMLVVWLFVERVEAAVRMGLYEAGSLGKFVPPPAVCNCASPPCELRKETATVEWLAMATTFLADYFCTRYFAASMRQQKGLMENTIAVSERIAFQLARYEVLDAQQLVEGTEGSMLPEALRNSYRQLLQNLESYRPFLPQNVLFAVNAEEYSRQEGSPDDFTDSRGWSPRSVHSGDEPEKGSLYATDSRDGKDRDVPATAGPLFRLMSDDASESQARGLGEHKLSVDASLSLGPRVLSLPAPPEGIVTPPFAAVTPDAQVHPPRLHPPTETSLVSTVCASYRRHVNTTRIARRNVSLVATNVVGLISYARDMPPGDFVDFCKEMFLNVTEKVSESRGVLENFDGDHSISSWNTAARPCKNHGLSALCAATAMQRHKWKPLPPPRPALANKDHALAREPRLSLGVSTDNALCGIIGCETTRRYAIVGGVNPWVRVLEKLARVWECGGVCDDVIARAPGVSKAAPLLLWPEAVLYPKRFADLAHLVRPRPYRVWQILPQDCLGDEHTSHNKAAASWLDGISTPQLSETPAEPVGDAAAMRRLESLRVQGGELCGSPLVVAEIVHRRGPVSVLPSPRDAADALITTSLATEDMSTRLAGVQAVVSMSTDFSFNVARAGTSPPPLSVPSGSMGSMRRSKKHSSRVRPLVELAGGQARDAELGGCIDCPGGTGSLLGDPTVETDQVTVNTDA
eukprot:TRINITY_DN6822_c0_g2_i1.p1 TRINITY_DN6822_c0_g2~~TRINITY_DN6822_c0_g2_i1.p1  ORF type:complete len:837 (+),score=122.56 TRINITY_DN6822_c0_g2_i1:36-2513(+)